MSRYAGMLALLVLDLLVFTGFAFGSKWGPAAVAGLAAVLASLAIATDLILSAVDRQRSAEGHYSGVDR